MLVPMARKEPLFKSFAEIPVVVKNLHDAVLNDVDHKRSIVFITVRDRVKDCSSYVAGGRGGRCLRSCHTLGNNHRC